MKSIKLMLSGIMLALIAIFFLLADSMAALVILVIGVLVFLVGLLYDVLRGDKWLFHNDPEER